MHFQFLEIRGNVIFAWNVNHKKWKGESHDWWGPFENQSRLFCQRKERSTNLDTKTRKATSLQKTSPFYHLPIFLTAESQNQLVILLSDTELLSFLSDYFTQITSYEEHADKFYEEQERGYKKIDADITRCIYDATNIIPNQTSHPPSLQPRFHNDEKEKACKH